MWTWLASFFVGKAVPYLAKGWERFISILVWVLVITGLSWSVYVTVIKPHIKPTPTTTNTQNVQPGGVANTTNVTYEIKVGFGGCARIPQVKDVKK